MATRLFLGSPWLLLFCLLPTAAWSQDCAGQPSWIFRHSTYSHAPETGGRVAQYDRIAPVEGLEDPRQFTSGYRRTRTTLRGADGSVDATYQVQSWGNGRGGLDAEWERFHDAWRQSYISGGSYYSTPYVGPYGYGGGYGYGGHGYGGHGYPPPYGHPSPYGYGHGGYGHGGYPGPGPVAPWGPHHHHPVQGTPWGPHGPGGPYQGHPQGPLQHP